MVISNWFHFSRKQRLRVSVTYQPNHKRLNWYIYFNLFNTNFETLPCASFTFNVSNFICADMNAKELKQGLLLVSLTLVSAHKKVQRTGL